MKYGFLTVAAAIPSVRVADLHYNLEEIKRLIDEAERQHVEVVVFPELSLTGYTCQDLFRQRTLIDGTEQAVLSLLEFTMRKDVIAIVGAPVEVGNLLLNCAIVIQQGRILGTISPISVAPFTRIKALYGISDNNTPCSAYAGET